MVVEFLYFFKSILSDKSFNINLSVNFLYSILSAIFFKASALLTF